MTEEADEQFKMPPLSQRQREELLKFQDGGYSGVMMHGTLQKNLLAKGFLQRVEHDGRRQLELTELGRKVAEQVREDDIRRAGKRMATELTQTLVAADQEMRTPPPARPGRAAAAVQFDPLDQGNVRRRELDDIMNWLRDPSRLARIQQLQRCGHCQTCPSCLELEGMRKAMEHALIRLAGEVDLLGQQLAYREQELGRVKGAFRGILRSQENLLKAVAAGVGFGRVDEIKTD